jgi:hypothetical protein
MFLATTSQTPWESFSLPQEAETFSGGNLGSLAKVSNDITHIPQPPLAI